MMLYAVLVVLSVLRIYIYQTIHRNSINFSASHFSIKLKAIYVNY